jgi:AcrR family transcriptional regulator
VPRTYDSSRRKAQAEQTRRAILEAAQRHFEQHGYVATTMEAVARDAGVALKTVYLAVTTKAGLLRAVWDLVLKGDTDDAPVAVRPWYVEVLEEPDLERKLRLVAHHSVIVKQRIGPMLRAIRSAAVVDPDGRELWDLIQSDFHANQRAIVDSLAAVRRGLDVDRATDILWTLNHPDVWLLFVDRGWSPEDFEAWFADSLVQQLLDG